MGHACGLGILKLETDRVRIWPNITQIMDKAFNRKPSFSLVYILKITIHSLTKGSFNLGKEKNVFNGGSIQF